MKQVKCIKGDDGRLTKGNYYNITETFSGLDSRDVFYRVTDDSRITADWYKSRFEDINPKVYIIPLNETHCKFLQQTSFDNGFEWISGGTLISNIVSPIILNKESGKVTMAEEKYCSYNGYKKITTEEFIDTKYVKPINNKLKLNDSLTAEIICDDIVVGCQTIPFSKIDELVDMYLTLKG